MVKAPKPIKAIAASRPVGVAMIASVLNSERAVQMNIVIMRAIGAPA